MNSEDMLSILVIVNRNEFSFFLDTIVSESTHIQIDLQHAAYITDTSEILKYTLNIILISKGS